MTEQNITVKDIVAALTTKRICECVPVKNTAVSNAVVNNKFPAAWKYELDALAKERDVTIPDNLFNWKIGKRLAKQVSLAE